MKYNSLSSLSNEVDELIFFPSNSFINAFLNLEIKFFRLKFSKSISIFSIVEFLSPNSMKTSSNIFSIVLLLESK